MLESSDMNCGNNPRKLKKKKKTNKRVGEVG